jgi:myosin heavy subunit
MSEMTDSEKLAYGLITTAGREDEFKKRIDELVQRRQDAEAIEKKNQEDSAALVKLREDTNLEVAQKTAALNKAQKDHDASADEAHKRIILAQQQSQEMEKLKFELDKREKDLTIREKVVADTTQMHERSIAQLRTAIDGVQKLKAALDEVRRQSAAVSEALG